jgi:hypothetical protein
MKVILPLIAFIIAYCSICYHQMHTFGEVDRWDCLVMSLLMAGQVYVVCLVVEDPKKPRNP